MRRPIARAASHETAISALREVIFIEQFEKSSGF
jgi:hypothetical protein